MSLHDPYGTEYGSPSDIRAEAKELSTVAANIDAVAELLRAVSTKGVWDSAAGRTFADRVGATPEGLLDIAGRLREAAGIIAPYADRLEESQRMMAMMRRNYADSDAVVTAREATLAGMTPEDPQYARVDREHREAADRRHYSLTDYTREGESAAETERDMARKLDDICQDLTDPAAYDLFEGASRLGTGPLVNNPVTTFLPIARPVRFLGFADPVGLLARRVVYEEGSYSAVATAAGASLISVVKGSRGRGAKEAARTRAAARKAVNSASGPHGPSTSPIAARPLVGARAPKSARVTVGEGARRVGAMAKASARNRVVDTVNRKTGVTLIEDMNADWAALVGAGRTAKGVHVVRYTGRSVHHVDQTITDARSVARPLKRLTDPDPDPDLDSPRPPDSR